MLSISKQRRKDTKVLALLHAMALICLRNNVFFRARHYGKWWCTFSSPSKPSSPLAMHIVKYIALFLQVSKSHKNIKTKTQIGHFRVPKTLTSKMRPSTQPFLWKWVEICMRMKNHFHVKGWSLNLVLIQRPGGTRKWPVEISMIQDFPLSHSSRGLTDAIFPLVNSRCHLEDTYLERFWTVILNAYKKKTRNSKLREDPGNFICYFHFLATSLPGRQITFPVENH